MKQRSDRNRRLRPQPKPDPNREAAHRRLIPDRRLTRLVKRIDAHVSQH